MEGIGHPALLPGAPTSPRYVREVPVHPWEHSNSLLTQQREPWTWVGVRCPGSHPISRRTPVTLGLSFLISDLCFLVCSVAKVKVTRGR